MASSNAVAGPRAVIDLLRTDFSSEADLTISYADPGRDYGREAVFGGRIAGPHDPAAFRAGGRRQRAETLTWNLYVRVANPGLTPEENAARALEIGTTVEERLAAGDVQDGAGVPGMKAIEAVGFALENSSDDSGPISEIAYNIQFRSIIQ